MSQQQEKTNKYLTLRLVGVVAGMFLFAFALIPIYDVFCEVTGINGKTKGQALYKELKIDTKRLITVEFITNVNRGMPWEFKALQKSIQVHPGQLNEVKFYARNKSEKDLIGQSIPSISPGEASLYLAKTECFCFDIQPLSAGVETEMPMRFYIDPDLPEHITRLTLSYRLFNVTDKVKVASLVSY